MSIKITPAPAHQKPSGKLYLGVNQLNLVDGDHTLVELDTISTNFTDGIEDTVNHRITPGQAGYYSIMGMVTLLNPVADRAYKVAIYISGTTWIFYYEGWAGGGVWFAMPVLVLAKLSATDYIELYARSDSGDDTVDILAAENRTFLTVQRVR